MGVPLTWRAAVGNSKRRCWYIKIRPIRRISLIYRQARTIFDCSVLEKLPRRFELRQDAEEIIHFVFHCVAVAAVDQFLKL